MPVTGTVTLAGDLLGSALINGYTGTLGDTIYAIYNDGSDPVIGTFFNGALPVPEGGTVAISGLRFAVHYAANADGGAVGNDVALVRVVPEPGALPSLLAALAFAGRRRGFFRQRAA